MFRERELEPPSVEENTNPSVVDFTIRLDRGVRTIEGDIGSMMKDEPEITLEEMGERLSVSKSTVYRAVMGLKETGKVERTGGSKGRSVLKP